MSNPFAELINKPVETDSWRWGTVVGTSPLRVQLDGDSEPLNATPDTLAVCAVGDRVRCHVYNRRVTIMGRAESPTDKRPLTLKNGWQGYGPGYQSPEYEVFPNGRVQLHGMLRPGTKTNNTVIATVPASLAPSNRRVFVTGAGQLGAGRVDVTATGDIVLSVLGSTAELANLSWLSLENVSW